MKKIVYFFNIALIMIAMFSINSLYAQPLIPGNWELTFEENFDGDSLDPDKWVTGGTNFNAVGGNSPDNITVRNGNVEIKAEKRPLLYAGENHEYVGSEITTFQKFRQKYGYFEARIKYDAITGVWPAFWTMPDRGKYGNPNQNRESYIKFDLSTFATPITSAKLKIRVTAFTNSDVYSDVSIHKLLSNNWDENSITWNNKPDFYPGWLALFYATTEADKINEITEGEDLVIDVTDYINSQISASENAGFALVDLSMRSNLITFGSKESAAEADRPRLEIDGSNIFTTDDAYVRAGIHADNNYGSDTRLEVKDPWESTSSTRDGGMEIDIMESLGVWGDHVTAYTVHWGGYGADHQYRVSGEIDIVPTDDGYHVYAVNWQPGRIDFYIDDQLLWTFEDPNVGSVESYIRLTMNLGGWKWSGNEIIDDANLPANLYVDYVRVYEHNPTEDNVTLTNGSSLVAQGEVATVSVAYEASTTRDITAVLKLNEAPFTEYTSVTKSVSAGVGNAQLALSIPTTVPIGTNYSYQTYITPTGGDWLDSLDDMEKSPVEVVLGGSNDKIHSVNGPLQVSQGEVITITVDYGALDDRDINTVLQLNEPPWTTYGSATKSVTVGVDAVDITFTVDSDAPEGVNYQYQTSITPTGSSWRDRLDSKNQAPVTVISASNFDDKINFISGPTSVSQGEIITVSVDYEVSANRDLQAVLKLNESPWTTYATEIKNLPVGTGTAQFVFAIPNNTPAGANYFYQTQLTPTGGNWTSRFDYMYQAPVAVTSNNQLGSE
ncbi:MAG: DNRLRE domain-containing protein [Gammaproteobacteria bacterium]|nr:DNRLRE domain-containing protein [Gammaproteobacteria bacterium]